MSDNHSELALVIPVYNEEAIVGAVLEDWSRMLQGLGIAYEIHVYDGGSRDRTAAIVGEIAQRNPRVRLQVKPNTAHGPTILFGYRENADTDWLFQVDSDNEMSAESFPALWSRRHEYDLLLGRRGASHRPFFRRVISLCSRIVVGLFYGPGIHYVNSPYRLMRSAAFRNYFALIPATTLAPNIILSGIACLKKFRIYETTVEYRYRTTGAASVHVAKALNVALRSFWETARFRFAIR